MAHKSSTRDCFTTKADMKVHLATTDMNEGIDTANMISIDKINISPALIDARLSITSPAIY